MDSSIQTWQAAIQGIMNDADEVASSLSSDEQEGDVSGKDANLTSQVAFWGRETLVNCVCGAPPDSYCTCLPTSLQFMPEGDYFQQQPMTQDHRRFIGSESAFSVLEPQIREDSRPAVPTRKEVCKAQAVPWPS